MNSSASDVWKALTTSEQVSKYLFGAKVESEWKVGSRIVYSGNFNGNNFRDVGTITALEEGRLFSYSYWSANHGTANVPENHVTVSYLLEPEGNGTILTVEQKNYRSADIARMMDDLWDVILKGLKETVQSNDEHSN